jgi:3-deoxy-D-manno-octulosonic-acid transferase
LLWGANNTSAIARPVFDFYTVTTEIAILLRKESAFMMLLIFIAYQILQLISLPIILAILIVKQIRRKIIGNIAQRLGFVPVAPTNRTIVWIHAVSVGEVLATQELINHIKRKNPATLCYLTVGTISGMQMAKQQIAADIISFLPYDFLPCMLLAYHRISPSKLILIESELWPNLIVLARFNHTPCILLNARINPYSRSRAFRFRFFFKHLINNFSAILTQSSRDKDEFIGIGVDPNKITVLGNIKAFNVMAKKAYRLKTHPLSQPLPTDTYPTLLVGSLHPKEDALYLSLFAQLKQQYPNLRLILAPRHFTWQQQLEENVKQTGYKTFVWTPATPIASSEQESLGSALHRTWQTHDIVMVCTLGELFNLYPYATLFALGGTFVPVGGHNLLEPAVWATPTLLGPFYQNCRDIADRLEQVHGIVKVATASDLVPTVAQLLANPQQCQAIGKNSYVWIEHEAKRVEETLIRFID